MESPLRVNAVVRSLIAGVLALSASTVSAADTAEIPSPNGMMTAEIYKPAGDGPFPVVVFSHGRAGDPRERAQMNHAIAASVASYWTGKGFAVVAPFRPGYGPTGGFDAEDHGPCDRSPDYARTASQAAEAIVAAVLWTRTQPWAKPDRLLLEGQSVGGFATVAAAARNPAGVVGYVNFAGGSGGDPKRNPGASCKPELIGALYAGFARSTTVPGIWLYAVNDEYWGPDAPKTWGRAYDANGGRAKLVFTGPTPNGKGHSLLVSAPRLWTGELDAFLNTLGF
jgi:dienelactone hydrolase